MSSQTLKRSCQLPHIPVQVGIFYCIFIMIQTMIMRCSHIPRLYWAYYDVTHINQFGTMCVWWSCSCDDLMHFVMLMIKRVRQVVSVEKSLLLEMCIGIKTIPFEFPNIIHRLDGIQRILRFNQYKQIRDML